MALIHEMIPKIMADIDPIAKAKQGHGYKYRGIDDVYAAVQLVLAKHGVFCVPKVLSERSEERASSKGTALIYRILHLQYTFFASDGSYVECTVIGEGMDSGDKASNKAMSVAQKYALLQLFCIPTSEPKDPEIDNHEVKASHHYDGSSEQKIHLMKLFEKHGIPQGEMKKTADHIMGAKMTLKEADEWLTSGKKND